MRSRIVLVLMVLALAGARADLKPASLFTDNAVLQQGAPVPVWGTAEPGEEITVTFGGEKKSAKADAKGGWIAKLPKMKASAEPRKLVISSLHNTIAFTNVVVGEVWICSGQSNMEFPLLRAHNAAEAAAAATDPLLRVFDVKKAMADEPLKNASGSWKPANSNSVWGFTAVGYFFGRDIRADKKVPVGLIGTYWGGTPAESWTAHSYLERNPVSLASSPTTSTMSRRGIPQRQR